MGVPSIIYYSYKKKIQMLTKSAGKQKLEDTSRQLRVGQKGNIPARGLDEDGVEICWCCGEVEVLFSE